MQLQWATRNVWTMEALKPFIGAGALGAHVPGEQHAAMRVPALPVARDWPVDPLYPWNQVQSAIDRIGLYGEGKPLGIHEAISRRQSLRMHTRGTAYQLHQEKSTGTVEVGKLADLVMLDRDVATLPGVRDQGRRPAADHGRRQTSRSTSRRPQVRPHVARWSQRRPRRRSPAASVTTSSADATAAAPARRQARTSNADEGVSSELLTGTVATATVPVAC